MTRLRRLLEPVNWKHTVGELTMIVLGIVLGLQMNACYEDYETRQVELATLRELRSGFASDLEDARGNLDVHRNIGISATILIRHLDSGQPYHDSLAAHYGRILGGTIFLTNSAAYETLQSRGLELISNDSLRIMVAGMHSARYAAIRKSEDNDSYPLLENLWPHYMRNFEDVQFFRSGRPRSYDGLRRDTVHRGLLEASLAARRVIIPQYEDLSRDLASLVRALDEESARLD